MKYNVWNTDFTHCSGVSIICFEQINAGWRWSLFLFSQFSLFGEECKFIFTCELTWIQFKWTCVYFKNYFLIFFLFFSPNYGRSSYYTFSFFNPSHTTDLFLYPLSIYICDVFRGYRKRLMAWNGLITDQSINSQDWTEATTRGVL